MPTHSATCRFVCPNTSTCVVEGTKFVRCGCEYTVVIGRNVTEGSKSTTIDESVDIKARNSSLLVSGHLDFDVTRVSASIDPVHFFSSEIDSNWTSCFSSENGCAHLVREGIRFTTKTTSNKRSDYIDLVHWNLENGRKGSMGVVWYLLRRVQLKTTVWIPMSNDSMWFSESMMNTFHTPLPMRRGCRIFDEAAISKFLEHTLLNVGCSNVIFTTPVNRFILIFQSLSWVKNGFKDFPFDFKQVQCFHGCCFINSSDTSNEIAHVSNLLNSHGMLIFCYR